MDDYNVCVSICTCTIFLLYKSLISKKKIVCFEFMEFIFNSQYCFKYNIKLLLKKQFYSFFYQDEIKIRLNCADRICFCYLLVKSIHWQMTSVMILMKYIRLYYMFILSSACTQSCRSFLV